MADAACAQLGNRSRRCRAQRVGLAALLAITLVATTAPVRAAVRPIPSPPAAQSFYDPPVPLPPSAPGDILRLEALNVSVPHGAGYRILYRGERADGTPTVASGMVFLPEGPAPPGGRPVVAWAHPTVGMGPECAPSRLPDPLTPLTWLGDMLARGWVVTATDYAGLGTPGVLRYLVGQDEARDVLNAVRAAQRLEGSDASGQFALWGHSQGGHAVLLAAQVAAGYAPSLSLVAVAAAAPAAEIAALLQQQYDQAASWAIGPEVTIAWPTTYPIDVTGAVLSGAALRNYERLAHECIKREVLEVLVRAELRESYFRVNPLNVPSWYYAAQQETAPPTPPHVPAYIAQGLGDRVVLPNTTALYAQRACQAGSNLSVAWIENLGHDEAARAAGFRVTSWLDDRFAGRAASSTCDQPSPVPPAEVPAPPAVDRSPTID